MPSRNIERFRTLQTNHKIPGEPGDFPVQPVGCSVSVSIHPCESTVAQDAGQTFHIEAELPADETAQPEREPSVSVIYHTTTRCIGSGLHAILRRQFPPEKIQDTLYVCNQLFCFKVIFLL